MSQVALIVKTKTQPGKRDQMRRMFEQHLGPRAQANDSQTVVVWCDDDNDPDLFYLFELYSDRAAWQVNALAPWAAEYFELVQPLVTSSEMLSGTPLWAKGINL